MFGWLRARLQSAAAGLGRVSATTNHRGLSLISNWLANVLWLIDNTWAKLVKLSYGSNSVAYACIRLLSQAIPEARLKVYQEKADGTREELPQSHEAMKLIRRPNELMTEFEFWELTTIQLAVVGRSVWFKERANNGKILNLWPLRPDRVGPVYSLPDAPEGQKVINGYSYQDPGTGQYSFIPRADALAFNFPDPDGESGGIVEGFGPLSACRMDVSADNAATSHVGALLANYAQPSVALRLTDTIQSEEQANLIKAKFRSEFGGAKLGTPAILDAGAEIQVLGFSLRDLDFSGLRGDTESRICAATGVPPILAGVKVGLDRSTMANFEEARLFFTETTLAFYWRRYSDQMSNDIASEFGDDLVCEFDTSMVKALAKQFDAQLKPWRDAFLSGALTLNAYAEHMGIDPYPPEVGDVLYIPTSVVVTPATPEARAALEKLKPEPVMPALPPVEEEPEEGEPVEVEIDEEGEAVAAGKATAYSAIAHARPPAKALPAATRTGVTVIEIDDELAEALGLQ